MTDQPKPTVVVLTAEELASLLKSSLESIYRFNAKGLIPRPSRLGGQLRWKRAEIEAWIDAGMPSRSEWEAVLA